MQNEERISMKPKYRFSRWQFKLLAFLLAAVCLFFGAVGAYAFYWNAENVGVFEHWNYQETWRCKNTVQNLAARVMDKFSVDPAYDNWARLLGETDYRFIVLEESTGRVVASYTDGLDIQVPENMGDNPYLREYNYRMELEQDYEPLRGLYVADEYYTFSSDDVIEYGYVEDIVPEVLPDRGEKDTAESVTYVTYQILNLLPDHLTAHSGDAIWEGWQIYCALYGWTVPGLVSLIVCALLALACLIFLCCQAGHRPGQEEIAACWFDRIPLDLLAVVAVAAGVAAVGCVCGAVDMNWNESLTLDELTLIVGLLAAGFTVCGELILGFFTSLAARIKLGAWWSTMLTWKLCRWAWGLVKKLLTWIWSWGKKPFLWLWKKLQWAGQTVSGGVRAMQLVPKAALAIVAALGLDALLLLEMLLGYNRGSWPFWFLLAALYNLVLLAAAIFAVGQMKQLQDAAGKLAAGDLDHQLDTSRMYWEFKRHGDNLNAIAGGMNKAVEQRMKSERLKTELITNVSHDIKTPLTSIVNYVDLLQKPHTEAEGIQYLEVLDRQAKRLKRLTENLVEASKASTGNLPVDLAPTSVTEIMNQAAAEYRERLEAGKLDLVLWLNDNLTVMADGKLLWRVLDNLLSNVIKYALAGTRVYLTARKDGTMVNIAVKNISRDPLNIDADELMERFVRGDSARSTEGSGLGLNIARSLTQLQKGDFRLTVDGDLFKAEVILPVAEV